MDTGEYARMSALEIATAVRGKVVSAREVTEMALLRIAQTEPRVNAFIHVDAAAARGAADAVDRGIAQGLSAGLLAGVPVSVKDLVNVAGLPTSGGSAVFAGRIASADAAPVARLRDAGAVIIGKTTTPEFGHKPITSSPLFGETLNPWNRRFTAGGSSGGAAASLAANQVPLAVGTDGGGSIRIPASVCGVFGLKATLGRIAHVDAADLFGNNSFIGPMARNLDDPALMYRVMSGPDSRDPWSRRVGVNPEGIARPGRPRIGWARLVGNPVIDDEVGRAFDRAIKALDAAGYEMVPVALDFTQWEPQFRVLLQAMLAGRFGPELARNRARFDPSFATTIDLGLTHSAVDLIGAITTRTEMYRAIETLFADVDLLVTPTLAAASIAADTDPHAPLRVAGRDCGPIRAAWYPYTYPFNLTGHPAISLPCGWQQDGLPIGLQIAGRWDGEQDILHLSRWLVGELAVEARVWV